jgi:hypothetical protein
LPSHTDTFRRTDKQSDVVALVGPDYNTDIWSDTGAHAEPHGWPPNSEPKLWTDAATDDGANFMSIVHSHVRTDCAAHDSANSMSLVHAHARTYNWAYAGSHAGTLGWAIKGSYRGTLAWADEGTLIYIGRANEGADKWPLRWPNAVANENAINWPDAPAIG